MERAAIDQLLSLAAGQQDLVTIQQAAKLGVSLSMLLAASKRGWLHRERRGVFSVAGARPSSLRPVVAAALAGGPEAVISHTTAAEQHAFFGVMAAGIELTIPHRLRRNLQGVTVHR